MSVCVCVSDRTTLDSHFHSQDIFWPRTDGQVTADVQTSGQTNMVILQQVNRHKHLHREKTILNNRAHWAHWSKGTLMRSGLKRMPQIICSLPWPSPLHHNTMQILNKGIKPNIKQLTQERYLSVSYLVLPTYWVPKCLFTSKVKTILGSKVILPGL